MMTGEEFETAIEELMPSAPAQDSLHNSTAVSTTAAFATHRSNSPVS